MSNPTDQLAKTLFQKDSLAECSVLELQQLVNQYPYFGPAHVLMTEKLKIGDPTIYNVNLKKSMLYFNNPIWYQTLLKETGDARIISTQKTNVPEAPHQEINMNHDLPGYKKAEQEVQTDEKILNIETPRSGNQELIFEPFHTIDYFASQGIKFSEEEKPTDRFGKQLKSFTDWLKTMKRIPESHPGDTTITDTESQTDNKITHLAAYSIENRDIVTESMAEVWEKQGNIEKAIAIYHKLSLHNPSKSPYFAAKIDQLKKTI